jgi:UDP:flavonoid glycosyltransferase YjiC (YdhE family)
VRVLFASTRGAGHFNPLVPFIDASLRGGHEVLVAGPPPLEEAVERAGYPFRVAAVGAGLAVEGDPERESVRRSIDPAALRDAVETVLGDPGYGRVARAVADEMRALPPTDEALAVLR